MSAKCDFDGDVWTEWAYPAILAGTGLLLIPRISDA
jgi:hypothetical protein